MRRYRVLFLLQRSRAVYISIFCLLIRTTKIIHKNSTVTHRKNNKNSDENREIHLPDENTMHCTVHVDWLHELVNINFHQWLL